MASLRAVTAPRGCMAVSSRRPCVIVRAEGQINPSIRKNEAKVADFVTASELPKPKAVLCRCWRSTKFPYCDGAHLQHNKDTGDNVGPLVIDTAAPASPQ
ncbi:hypothetical protein Vretimale_13078 [Volvox reticuliferus]|uniref:Iron-binding zinc finger CDGSH type domain-containing protein n=1 Tax=Volvox reticuliferus TaxID=1737510 RepID=A0A8J4GJL7_9CHLO|nr:hypothetical protein Vretimale_13078 [Volvox reticuliferus]